jgi:hypothetical protein
MAPLPGPAIPLPPALPPVCPLPLGVAVADELALVDVLTLPGMAVGCFTTVVLVEFPEEEPLPGPAAPLPPMLPPLCPLPLGIAVADELAPLAVLVEFPDAAPAPPAPGLPPGPAGTLPGVAVGWAPVTELVAFPPEAAPAPPAPGLPPGPAGVAVG